MRSENGGERKMPTGDEYDAAHSERFDGATMPPLPKYTPRGISDVVLIHVGPPSSR
jgi:hypothetical protein